MKRLFLTSLILLVLLPAQAGVNSYKAIITCTDGSTEELDVVVGRYDINTNYASFSDDASHIYFLNPDGVTISYPVDYIASITFENYDFEGNDYALPYSTDFDVAFSDDDETSYSSVTEKVTTKETDADYGDFVENYEDDDESKGTVTSRGAALLPASPTTPRR